MSNPVVVAVIPHYYPERVAGLWTLVEALQAGSMPPVQTIIWDNGDPPLTWQDLPAVSFVRPVTNFGPAGRFIAALTIPAPDTYILFLDNDVTVYPDTVANLVAQHAALDAGVLAIATLEGREVRPGRPYRGWPKVYGRGLTQATPVGVSLGRGELVPAAILPRLLQHIPFSDPTLMTADDLWFSAAAAKEQLPISVVPCVPGVSDLRDLPRHGTGISAGQDYQNARNVAIAQITERLGVWRV